MKKKIFLIALMVALFLFLFAVSISAAEPSYKDGEWIYAADGTTKLAIRDTDGNPLIWYMNGEELKWVRADQTDESQSVYVKYSISAGGSGFDSSHTPTACLKDIDIYDNGVQIECSSINSQLVLFNMEKLDIDAINGWLWGNKNGCCTIMRGIVLPNSLKYIGQEGFTNTKIVQIWNLENTKLEYINACSFAATTTLTQEATNGVFKCPQTMQEPISAAYSQIKVYILNPISEFNTCQKWYQFLRGCRSLEKVFVSSHYSIGFGEEAFRDTPNQYVTFFTGTQEEATQMRDNTQDYCNGGFKASIIISYDTYLADQAKYDNSTNQAYIVYGYNYCEAFYDGIHKEADTVNGSACYLADCERCNVEKKYIGGDQNSSTHSFLYTYAYNDGFTNVGTLTSTCTNAGCNYCADKTPYESALKAIFGEFKYSVREDDKFGIVMEYEIDREALTIYEAGANTTVKFGVVAIAEGKYNSEQDLINADGTTEYKNVIVADVSNNTPVKVTLLINGTEELWESHKATPFYILGYAVNAGVVEYFQNASSDDASKLTTISYNGAKEVA